MSFISKRRLTAITKEIRNFFGVNGKTSLARKIRRAVFWSYALDINVEKPHYLCIQDYTYTIFGAAKIHFKKGEVYEPKFYKKKYHINIPYLEAIFSNKEYFTLFNKRINSK